MTTIERLLARIRENPQGKDILGFPFTASPPASREDVRVTEDRLGFALPPLLAEIYVRVANGGIGPGYGLIVTHRALTQRLEFQFVTDQTALPAFVAGLESVLAGNAG